MTWDSATESQGVERAVGPRFGPGQRVRHAAFGEGLVLQSRADNGDEMVTVIFEEAGPKRLLASLAHLEVVDVPD